MLESDNAQTDTPQTDIEARHAALLSAVKFASNSFLTTPNWRDALDSSLQALGEACGASRAYFFENTTTIAGAVLTSQTAEWTAPGTEPQIDNQDLQQVPYVDAGMGRWLEQMEKGQPVYGFVADFPESEQPILDAQDIRSIAAMPVHCAGRLAGFLGFDDCEQQRVWTGLDFNVLSTAASTIGAALEHERLGQLLGSAQKSENHKGTASELATEYNTTMRSVFDLSRRIRMKCATGESVDTESVDLLAANSQANRLVKELLHHNHEQSEAITSVDLGDVCRLLISMLRPVFGPGVSWTVDIEDPGPVIQADAGLIIHTMINLCLNSRDAINNSGHLELSCESTAPDNQAISARESFENRRCASVSISNTDGGIEKKALCLTETSATGDEPGMSVVSEVVTRLGGFTDARGTVSKGSVITLFFPLAGTHTSSNDSHFDNVEPEPVTLLLVDDEEIVLQSLWRLLENRGYRVLGTTSAIEACSILEKHATSVDILFTDWSMPQMRGEELIAVAQKLNPNIKSIIMSGYMSDQIPLDIDTRSIEILQKPTGYEEIQRALNSLLEG